jgi:hypothetical protein
MNPQNHYHYDPAIAALENVLSKYNNLVIVIGLIVITALQSSSFAADSVDELDYPRIEHFEQGSVTVDFPSIDSWKDFLFLEAWLPVEVRLKSDGKSRVGAVKVQAVTDIDFDQRTVRVSGPSLLETKFSDADTSDEVTGLAAMAFMGGARTVPLDVLLRLLPEDFLVPELPGGIPELNFEPPAIVVSETPLKLLSIDKEPIRAQIEGTSLEFVVNTNWSVFYNRSDERWYVLNDGAWQTNNYLSDGGWTVTQDLPADFAKLAANDEWTEVQEAYPASKPASPPTPFIISLEETELIQLDGSPRLSAIENTGIYHVRNTK